MEMSFDWNQYRKFFKPGNLPAAQRAYWIVENEAVVAGISGGQEDLDWTGASVQEIGKTLPGKEYVFLQKDRVDQMLMEAIGLPHFPQQLESLRQKMLHSKDLRVLSQKNFFEAAFQSFWKYLLPNRFALYLQVYTPTPSGADSWEEVVIIFKEGVIERVFHPEMHYLKPERQEDPADRVNALSERLVIPSFGLLSSSSDWASIIADSNPFKRLGGLILRKKIEPVMWAPTMRVMAFLKWMF